MSLLFNNNQNLPQFILAEAQDVADNIGFAGWGEPEAIDRYFQDCQRRSVNLVGWRLSICGDFLYHSEIEHCPLTPGSFHQRYCSDITKKHDFLRLGAESARKYGISFFAYLAMFDEGWFPRFKFLGRTVEQYYQSEGFKFLTYDDNYALKPGLQSLDNWLDDPGQDEKDRYKMMIPAVEQGQDIPRDRPWAYCSRFIRKYPEFASETHSGFKMGRHLSYAYQQVREYRLSLLKEIAACGCDGFILDYTRWSEGHDVPLHDKNGVCVTGYDEPSKKLFKEKHGRSADSVDNADPQWIKCRAEASHTRFLSELREALPDNAIIANVGLNDPLKAGFVDVPDWTAKSLVDAVFVYQCQRDYYDPCTIATSDYPTLRERHQKSSLIQWTDEWLKKVDEKVPLLFNPWTRVYDEKDPSPGKCRNISERELYEQVRTQKQMGTKGVFLYQNYFSFYYHPLKLIAQDKPFEPRQYEFDDTRIKLKLYRKDDACVAVIDFAEPDEFLPNEQLFLPNEGAVTIIVDGTTVLHLSAKDATLEMGVRSIQARFDGSYLLGSSHRVVLQASSFDHCLTKIWQIDSRDIISGKALG